MLRVDELVASIKLNQSLGLDPLSNGSDGDERSFCRSDLLSSQGSQAGDNKCTAIESDEINAEKREVRQNLLSVLWTYNEKPQDEPF